MPRLKQEVAQRLGTYVMSMDEQDKIALRAEKLGVKVWEYLLQRYVVELFHTQDHVSVTYLRSFTLRMRDLDRVGSVDLPGWTLVEGRRCASRNFS